MSKDKLYQIIIGLLTLWGGFVGQQLWKQNTEIAEIKTEMKITKEWRLAREARTEPRRTR